MASVTKIRNRHASRRAGWLPLALLPIAVFSVGVEWPPWLLMWSLAFSIFFGLKWLSAIDCLRICEPTVGRTLGYLLLWPGMNAKAFLSSSQRIERPRLYEWLLSVAKIMLGIVLLAIAAESINRSPWLAGCVGMVGIVFTLHCGLFHLLSILWRRAGINARPIMNAPILASSLGNFWGQRWNLAFRDLAHAYVFRPLVGRLGVAGATMAVFITSGIVHDLVISLPAQGGFGLPTLYFVIQGVGVLFEHSHLAKKIGLQKGIAGRLFCSFVILGPILLLLHRPFIDRVVVPMFKAIESLVLTSPGS